jgi:hypothetical protein
MSYYKLKKPIEEHDQQHNQVQIEQHDQDNDQQQIQHHSQLHDQEQLQDQNQQQLNESDSNNQVQIEQHDQDNDQQQIQHHSQLHDQEQLQDQNQQQLNESDSNMMNGSDLDGSEYEEVFEIGDNHILPSIAHFNYRIKNTPAYRQRLNSIDNESIDSNFSIDVKDIKLKKAKNLLTYRKNLINEHNETITHISEQFYLMQKAYEEKIKVSNF